MKRLSSLEVLSVFVYQVPCDALADTTGGLGSHVHSSLGADPNINPIEQSIDFHVQECML